MLTKTMVAAAAAVIISSAEFASRPPHVHAAECSQYGFDGAVQIVEDGTGWSVQFASRGSVASGQANAANDKTGEHPRTGTITGGFRTPVDLELTVAYPEGTQHYQGSVYGDGSTRGVTVGQFGGVSWHTAQPLPCILVPARAPGPEDLPPPSPPLPPKQAPTNAIRVDISNVAGGLKVSVGNSSNIPGNCTYDATAPNSLIPPTHRDFTVGAETVTSFQISGIATGTIYNTVTACRGNFEGKDVEIGRVELPKTF
jgi:hypothetical protein